MITQQEYATRRQRLIEKIGTNAVVIIPAAPELLRNADTDHLYRQNSDFYYLTGFKEPEAILVLAPGRKEGEFILFNRERNPAAEIWVGKRAGQEGVVKEFGAKQAFPIHTAKEKMPDILAGYARIYYPIGSNPEFDEQVIEWVKRLGMFVRKGINPPVELINLREILHEMRLFKSPAEIELMRYVANASAQAHIRAIKACRPALKEYDLQAELLYEFSQKDCYPPAYNCIVGAGANSCTLHYVDNQDELKNGDVILIDAGGEYQYYAADITRTFPINGKFSQQQKQIYEIVLNAQKSTIAMIKPGTPWNTLQENAVRVITAGLIQLGLLKGDLEKLIASKAYETFYMHQIGHWLGLDTHDVGAYKVKGQWRTLEPGIVLTVEPGIYIRPSSDVAEKWWNIGVRIEDDVLVTQTGCEVLTKAVPKEINEIEMLMQQSDKIPLSPPFSKGEI